MDLKGLQTYRTIQFSMNQGRLHVPKIYQITRQPFPAYPSRGQKIREPILFSQLGLADLSYLLHQQPTETHPNCQNFLQVFFEHLQPLPCPLPSPSSTSLTPLSSLPRVTGPRIYPTQRLTQELCESFSRFLLGPRSRPPQEFLELPFRPMPTGLCCITAPWLHIYVQWSLSMFLLLYSALVLSSRKPG